MAGYYGFTLDVRVSVRPYTQMSRLYLTDYFNVFKWDLFHKHIVWLKIDLWGYKIVS